MSETNILVEIAKQIPSLGVLVFLVITFLKHLSEQNKENRESSRINAEALNKVADALTELRIELKSHEGP